MSNSELIPIGIDLGTLHARVAIGNKNQHNLPLQGLVDTCPLPSIISNSQGSRYTLALVEIEKSNAEDETAEAERRHVFGEAARRSLERKKQPTILQNPASMVRELVRSSSSITNDQNGSDQKREHAAAFFRHLAELACDASSSHPSKLRTVVSVPVASTVEEQEGIIQSVESGINHAIADWKIDSDGSKSKRQKNKVKDDDIVIGIISDPVAVCVAHGLTEIETCGVIDLADPTKREAKSSWKNILVIDWGASGLTVTHIRRVSINSSLLSIVRHATDNSCSGMHIVGSLVSHCASMFERKNHVNGVLDSVKARHRLEIACESAVRTLSRAPTTTVAVDGLYEGMDMSVLISKPRFDMLVSDIMRKAEAHILSFISFEATEYDMVLLAGNVCEMPAAINLIRTKLFPNVNSGRCDIPPDEAVAIGCARHSASILSCETHSKSVGKAVKNDGIGPVARKVSVCPLTIGICKIENEIVNGKLGDYILKNAVPLCEAGEPLPANITRTVNLGDMNSYSLAVVQIHGFDPAVKAKILGKIENIEKDSEIIELTMELTAEGSLMISLNGGESCTLG